MSDGGAVPILLSPRYLRAGCAACGGRAIDAAPQPCIVGDLSPRPRVKATSVLNVRSVGASVSVPMGLETECERLFVRRRIACWPIRNG